MYTRLAQTHTLLPLPRPPEYGSVGVHHWSGFSVNFLMAGKIVRVVVLALPGNNYCFETYTLRIYTVANQEAVVIILMLLVMSSHVQRGRSESKQTDQE